MSNERVNFIGLSLPVFQCRLEQFLPFLLLSWHTVFRRRFPLVSALKILFPKPPFPGRAEPTESKFNLWITFSHTTIEGWNRKEEEEELCRQRWSGEKKRAKCVSRGGRAGGLEENSRREEEKRGEMINLERE